MPDYQLERLGTRSFEQLVQSLAVRLLGPKLLVYGDGPDGGREASFEGVIHCPPSQVPWSGYGVLQAKFRQRLDSSPRRNADWVIEQLEAEFRKLAPNGDRFARTRRERICPDYYILATNVVLSAAGEQGGKDRVCAVFEAFKKSHGLKDFAIWDGEQIRAFLEGQSDIRTAYSAWLLPGDVLTEMMRFLHLERADFHNTMRRYLECELLDDQFVRLGEGGYTDAKTIPLSSVFLDLPIQVTPDSAVEEPDNEHSDGVEPVSQDSDTFLKVLFEDARQNLKPSVHRLWSPPRKAGQHQPGRIVLVGGPGQGKTTVGQYACQILRAQLLWASVEPSSEEVRQALERIKEMSGDLPKLSARRYPVRIDLKHLAASLAAPGAEKPKGLLDYLMRRISDRTNSEIRPAEFRSWLAGYPWFLVLDGLDEVPASSNREQVMRAIRDFISVEAHHADADLLVLATTRPQGYSQEFLPSLYRHLTLAPLDPEAALLYGSRLAAARHPHQKTRIEQLTDKLVLASENPATARLMQSPLQITIMLALIEGGGEPPEQRWKLFSDYYDVIYRREKERDTAFSNILRRYEPDIHWIHHRAGWLLQQRNATPGMTDARLTHDEFEELVDLRLLSRGHDDAQTRRSLVHDIRLAATHRLVFLVGNTDREIGFEIRSLQEFMAAEHFFDGGELCVQQILHIIAPFPYWLNVFLFASGRIFFREERLIDSIVAICTGMNEAPEDAAQRAILSGSRLATEILKDGATRNQPRSARVLARCAARCFDGQEDEFVEILAGLFGGDAESVLEDELLKRLTGDPSQVSVFSWYLCLRLAELEKPWALELMEKRFPWTSERVAAVTEHMVRDAEWLPDELFQKLLDTAYLRPMSELRSSSPSQRFDNSTLHPVLAALLPDEDTDRWPLYLESGTGDFLGIDFNTRGAETLQLWGNLESPQVDLQSFHPQWRVAWVGVAFAHEPTLSNLVEQLRVLAKLCPEGLGTNQMSTYPWQVAVCLEARGSGRVWDEIIEQVAAGSLGNEEDWRRWEGNRKNEKMGLTLAQLRIRPQWGVSDEYLGLLFLGAGWTYYDNIGPFRLGEALPKALDHWPELGGAHTLIYVSCHGFYKRSIESSPPIHDSLDRFVSSCVSGRIWITTSLIAAALIERCELNEKARLLAKLGSYASATNLIYQGRLSHWTRVARIADEEALKLMSAAPTLQQAADVLCALSFLPPLASLEHIPEPYLAQLRISGFHGDRAADILQLNSLTWTALEAGEMVNRALTRETFYPGSLDALLEAIKSRGKAGLHLEVFLIELLARELPHPGKLPLSNIVRLLVKLVERRPTVNCLPEPTAIAVRMSN